MCSSVLASMRSYFTSPFPCFRPTMYGHITPRLHASRRCSMLLPAGFPHCSFHGMPSCLCSRGLDPCPILPGACCNSRSTVLWGSSQAYMQRSRFWILPAWSSLFPSVAFYGFRPARQALAGSCAPPLCACVEALNLSSCLARPQSQSQSLSFYCLGATSCAMDSPACCLGYSPRSASNSKRAKAGDRCRAHGQRRGSPAARPGCMRHGHADL
mmetsp:Transcript_2202/g.7197  ORF Transcript_2202/g.7197 Transcript_2202/m.7197 type:complete len:213 (-) Transcript_2202:265-903(-)